jgi:hypothetical protein
MVLFGSRRRLVTVPLALAALSLVGCPSLRGTGPEDASAVPTPGLVSVTIEYRQPNGCLNTVTPCGGPVVFFATWMRPGAEFPLTPDEGNYVWRGTALGVPVNFPPRGDPYEVRIFDPYLAEGPTAGFTAQRLKVGSEAVTRIEASGTDNEHGLVFVDDNGFGRSPY